MENPIKIDDLGGKPTIFGNIHMVLMGMKLPSFLTFRASQLLTCIDLVSPRSIYLRRRYPAAPSFPSTRTNLSHEKKKKPLTFQYTGCFKKGSLQWFIIIPTSMGSITPYNKYFKQPGALFLILPGCWGDPRPKKNTWKSFASSKASSETKSSKGNCSCSAMARRHWMATWCLRGLMVGFLESKTLVLL